MIIRARLVVTMDGPPIKNGAVVVSGKRIIDVGKLSEISAKHSSEGVIDLGEQALLPGLINAHCHLDYTCLRRKIPRQRSFTDWIRAINSEKATLSPKDYVRSINEGFAEAKRFGTTTIANLTAFPELISQIHEPIRTWWFAELIDVRDPAHANEIVDLAVDELGSQEHWGLAPHAPFTASVNLYRRCQEIARRENVLLTTHLAESREEMLMFRDAKGSLYDFLREIGRDMSDCGSEMPLRRFPEVFGDCTRSSSDSLAATSRLSRPCRSSRPLHSSTSLETTKDWILVHLNELSENDLDLLKKSRADFSVVHCPRSHAYFGHSPFQLERLRTLGLNVCLGTDSLASNEDLSLFGEIRAFRKEFPDVMPGQILEMITVNPAQALRQGNALGRVRPGFLADLIAVPITGSTSVLDEIVAFDRPVGWSIIEGRISA